MNIDKPKPIFHHIQALRGIAATLVVLNHALDALIKYGNIPPRFRDFFWHLGDAGVSTFFVISGFIMVMTTSKDFGSTSGTLTFVRKRLVRIVPSYWVATIAFCVYLLVSHKSFWIIELIKSLVFIPYVSPTTDTIQPLLAQGWTLNYELFFYAIFAITIPLPINWALSCLSVIFPSVYLAGLHISESHRILHFYSDRVILLFLVGAWIGYARLHWPAAVRFRSPALLISLALGVNLAAYWVSISLFSFPEWLLWSVQIFCVVVCAYSPQSLSGKYERVAEILGDASYCTYLFHVFVLAVLNRTLTPISPASQFLYLAGAVIGSNAIGLALNRILERPLTNVLRGESRRKHSGLSQIAP